MRPYSLTLAADQDFEGIFEYGLDNFGLDTATRYQNTLIKRFQSITENPRLYPTFDLRKGYRRSVCGVHSIYYREFNNAVEIVRILGRQDATRHLP